MFKLISTALTESLYDSQEIGGIDSMVGIKE